MSNKITVVLPTYNREKTLSRAIDSVINQTYQNWELFIVDDRSTDTTKQLIQEKYGDYSKINFIERPPSRPKGANACRNLGMERATGKYVAFLDSDDEWYPQKLEKQVKYIEENNHINRKILLYNQSKILTNGKEFIAPANGLGESEMISDYLMLNNGFIQTSSFFIQCNQLEDLRFDEELPRHQDLDFILNAENKGFSFEFIREPLVKIHWEVDSNITKKGWSPESSREFALKNKGRFSKKSYHNFLFTKVIINTLKYGKKKDVLSKFSGIELRYVSLSNYLRFIKHLFNS